MKKLIITLSLVAVFSSCKEKLNIKPDTQEDNVEAPVDIVSTDNIVLPVYTKDTVAEFLADKKNDTLYVTNFFATWCGPCMQEIPHFIKKKDELKGQAVKFTFVSIDAKSDWETKVKKFAAKSKLEDNIILLDGKTLDPAFYKDNFETWNGSGIPFTIIKKGNKREEIFGFTSEDMLNQKIKSLK